MHNHQPVGNFDWVFRDAANDSYIPFLDVLERHTQIKAGIHITGPLLEWFEKHMPEYLERIAGLVKKGRLEILGGAFYEPILSILPDCDKIGQIEMMSGWIEKRFGKKPSGFWVAERIWEPYFAGIYGSCGLSYTTLDNTHFQYAGLPEENIWGSYLTEDKGTSIRVLPIDYNLRYLIPFHEPQETIDYIGGLKERGVAAVTYADDGEKFGVWPGTKEWVYEKKWLERFFSTLEDNADWIDIVLPGDYINTAPPLGVVYLPTASYSEMMGWALPVEAQKILTVAEKMLDDDRRLEPLKPFIRGGFWRNFLTRYPESNNMYRRMLMVSGEVEAARNRPEYKEAVRELYMAQCNCGYWHGVFGGLYLNFLRRAVYEHLIMAERSISDTGTLARRFDFDGDGHDEVILGNDELRLIISPRQGGGALELDYFPKAFNIFDTMTRREELYHGDIPYSSDAGGEDHVSIHDGIKSKEDGIRKYLQYDWYRRLNFIDHFLPCEASLAEFAKCSYNELGDFIGSSYSVMNLNEEPFPEVSLERAGTVRIGEKMVVLRVKKCIAIPKDGSALTVTYRLECNEEVKDVMFGVEMNLGLQSGYADDSFIYIPGRRLSDSQLASTGIEKHVGEVDLTVGWMPLNIKIKFSKDATLWRFPIETVSQSEGGVERTYQSTCLVPFWNIGESRKSFEVTLTMEV